MKNSKISSVLIGSLSLMTSITSLTAPLVLAEERTSVDLENSQQQLKNHMENDILSTILNEAIEDTEEAFGELIQDSEDTYEKDDGEIEDLDLESEAEGESGTGTVKNQQIDFEKENQQIQMSELDGTVVDWGATPSGGEWVLYSDGLLTINGNFTPSFATWGYQNFIKSIKFIDEHQHISGDFEHFFTDYPNLEFVDFGSAEISGITSMRSMFYNLEYLEKVSFKDVTYSSESMLEDTGYMFYGARSLKEVDFRNFKTSNLIKMLHMFDGANSLESIDLSSFDTSKVDDMSYLFSQTTNLKFVDLSSFDTSNAENISHMFSEAHSIEYVDLTHFNTEKVLYMNHMFNQARNLKELDLSNFNTTKVRRLLYMFSGAHSLKKLNLSNFFTPNLWDAEFIFYGTTSLEELDISNFDTSNVRSMSNMLNTLSDNLSKLSLGNRTLLDDTVILVTHDSSRYWKGELEKNFLTSSELINYHNQLNKKNVYTRDLTVNLTFDTVGGNQIPDSIAFIGDTWLEPNKPTKSGFVFSGWYIDQEYTKKFDFNQPANVSTKVYAKWVEEYMVTIPAKISLNNEEQLIVSGTNNGEKTLKVNLKNDSSQINEEAQLLLSNKKDTSIKATSQVSWYPTIDPLRWNILTLEPVENGTSESAIIELERPQNIQAGSYEGTLTFDISYK